MLSCLYVIVGPEGMTRFLLCIHPARRAAAQPRAGRPRHEQACPCQLGFHGFKGAIGSHQALVMGLLCGAAGRARAAPTSLHTALSGSIF